MLKRETIIAGRTIMQTIKPVSGGRKKKGPRVNPTPEKMKKVNFRNAVKMLTAKLNHNFNPGDYHLVLTYKNAPDPVAAYGELKKFLRNCRNWCHRNGITFKWIAVTEYKHKRIHHHVIMNSIGIETVNKYWKHGFVRGTSLDDTGNYYKLAEYLLKETEKTFREADSPQKQRYACSRTVITPQEVKVEKIPGKQIPEIPQPLEGYYIDQDSLQVYEHAVLGVECMSCIMVNYDPEKKIENWPAGEKIKLRTRNYKISEDQQILLEL